LTYTCRSPTATNRSEFRNLAKDNIAWFRSIFSLIMHRNEIVLPN